MVAHMLLVLLIALGLLFTSLYSFSTSRQPTARTIRTFGPTATTTITTTNEIAAASSSYALFSSSSRSDSGVTTNSDSMDATASTKKMNSASLATKLVEAVMNSPLYDPIVHIARKTMQRTAESVGIDWEKYVSRLEAAADWDEQVQRVIEENSQLRVPAYYKQKFHGYREGNLCISAAIEQEIAGKAVGARNFPEHAQRGEAVMRQKFEDKILHLGAAAAVPLAATASTDDVTAAVAVTDVAAAATGVGAAAGVTAGVAASAAGEASAAGAIEAAGAASATSTLAAIVATASTTAATVASTTEAAAIAAVPANYTTAAAAGGATVVDFGCGTGTSTRRLARLFPSASRVIGIDCSPHMIAVGRLLLRAVPSRQLQWLDQFDGDNRITLKYALNEDTGLASASAAFVSISFILHELPRSAAVATLQEAHRILQPGGVLSILEMDPSAPGYQQLRANPLLFSIIRSTEPYLDQYFDEVAPALPELLREAGFPVVRIGAATGRHFAVVALKAGTVDTRPCSLDRAASDHHLQPNQ